MSISAQNRLLRQDIEILVKEREPFFGVWDASWDDRRRILIGLSVVDIAACEGHFPGKPYVPLIRIAERMAQTGLLLVGMLTADRTNETPIAIGHGNGSALSKRLPKPKLDLRIEAKEAPWWKPGVFFQKLKIVLALRRKCFVVDLVAYGIWGGINAYVPVANLRVYYILIGVPRRNPAKHL